MLGSALMRRLLAAGHCNIITHTHNELDLTVQGAVEEFFAREKPEYVFLAAGLTGGILANSTYPARFLHVNLMIQANVFENASRCMVKGLVFYGSSCVYPRICPQPMREDALFTGQIEPTSEAYASAKLAGMIGCRAYNKQNKDIRFIALLPNSIYGPFDSFDPQNSHVMAALIHKIHDAKACGDSSVKLWGSGSPRREFIYCDDAADASIFAMRNLHRMDNIHYNVGTSVDYSIRDLATIIADVIGYKGGIEWDMSKPDGTPRKLLDSSRFISFGWKPSVGIEDGIRATYQWYLENPEARRG